MLEKRYNPKKVSEGKYDTWKKNGYFSIHDLSKPPFSMVIPPPNITGKLHLGHAWDTTIQDIIARYKRLEGYDVLWLPGTDHAGIATQARVMKNLHNLGVDTKTITREEFLKAAWDWKDEYVKEIHNQWASLGLSLDYNKERFTLDERLNLTVRKVFVEMYNEGLIYQGERIINWDPLQMTALSNIEVNHSEEEGEFFYFRYHLVGLDKYLIIATTRPETMFGDVCVVVNPKDERYKNYIGQKVINPANGEGLPIIGDEYVDVNFGTGVMKCTPAHDPNDFLLAEKYSLARPICMNKDGTMNSLAGKYSSQDRFECRKNLVEDIKRNGDLVKIEKIVHAIGRSERSNAIVEPYLSKQWFVKMDVLSSMALKNQKTDQKVRFIPSRFEKVFTQWMDKVDDWCISRQLWWGHQIPVYYHKTTGQLLVSVNPPKDIENYVQDSDVLDTWFSSALWPFSTLGWPEKNEDYGRYFPNDLMVTAYDIIFFWVSRMIFQSINLTKKIPFRKVLIHGLVRDAEGKKMSKSAGNGVDPLQVIEQHGVDALRYFLTTNSTPGQDLRYSEEKVKAAGNYLNKIWNATRYILLNLGDDFVCKDIDIESLNTLDKSILSKLMICLKNVKSNMDKYDLAIASTHLYNFVYDDFCGDYLETSKVVLNGNDQKHIQVTKQVLYKVLKDIILMIYPYTPFIAEELYLSLPGHFKSIMLETYPKYNKKLFFKDSLEDNDLLNNIIKDIRNYKIDNSLAPNANINLKVVLRKDVRALFPYIKRFAFASEIEEVDGKNKDGSVFAYKELDLYIISNIDKKEILQKLNEKISFFENEIKRGENLLNNPSFMLKAPQTKIDIEKEKLDNNRKNRLVLLEKKKNLL